MPDEPLPPDDTPDDAELVAYLDGELDGAAARKVAARLAADPAARKGADALKKTFDLLDFLPKAEPSASFAGRTLDRLPAVKASDPAAPPVTPPPAPSATAVVPPMASAASGFAPVSPPKRGWAWLVCGAVAAGLALGVGYLGHAAARTYLFPAARDGDNLSLEADRRLIENLPLYAGVDDYAFAQRLAADATLFADDADPPAAAGPKAPPEPPPWADNLEPLIRAFKALPPDRRQQLRKLDAKLHEQLPADRDRLYRVLEGYALWLNRLPDGERAAVLAAPTPDLRAKAIVQVRDAQWQAHLPEARRRQLDAARDAADRAALIDRWKKDDAHRKEVWQLARKNWDTLQAAGVPWPFHDDALKGQVAEYVRTVLKVDGTSNGRVTAAEANRLREAERNGEWFWYGVEVLRLAEAYPTLPEPASGKPLLSLADLRPPAFRKALGDKLGLRQAAGKWPEFALAVADDAKRAGVTVPIPLGPSKPADYPPRVRAFVEADLSPRLTDQEREELTQTEGKWPDHPRRVVELARKYDLAVPAVTLPGSPRKWDETYRLARPAAKGGA